MLGGAHPGTRWRQVGTGQVGTAQGWHRSTVAVMVNMTVNARGLVTDAWIEEDDESVFPSIDIAALAVARDCRFDAKLGRSRHDLSGADHL